MEQEISMREIIEIIWKGKWVIVLITLFTMFTSGIINFFILDPVYEAKTTVMVSPNGTNLNQYIEQIGNYVVISATIEELKLDENRITVDQLRNKIRTEIVQDTNLFRIYVKDNSPEISSKIANSVTKNFISFIEKQQQEQMKTNAAFELDNIESQIKQYKSALAKIEQEKSNTPKTVQITKSLSNDPFLLSVVNDKKEAENAQLGSIQYQEEEVNPVYINLQEMENSIIIELEKLESKKAEIIEKMNNALFVSQEKLMIVSPAITPESPISPRKMVNIALAGVVGGMLSLLVVFFMHYWRSTSLTSNKEQNYNTEAVI